jgi:threonine dehydratase
MHLKCEHLQPTGSFKVRGALHRMLSLDADARARGVVTISAGNHAAAVAWAAARAGIDATVVMPETAARVKVAACRAHGANVVLHGNVFEALERCFEIRDREERTLVHPFDDPEILEGTGTIAMEILDQLDAAPDLVVVPVGGGGLIAGIAGALALASPDTRVVGVEPTGARAMGASLEEGRAVRLERVDTVADGLGAPMAGQRTYPVVRDHVETMVALSDRAILHGLARLLEAEKQLVEPAGAAGVAALLAGAVHLEPESVVVAVLSGGNVGLDDLPGLLAGAGAPEPS